MSGGHGDSNLYRGNFTPSERRKYAAKKAEKGRQVREAEELFARRSCRDLDFKKEECRFAAKIRADPKFVCPIGPNCSWFYFLRKYHDKKKAGESIV